MKTFINKLYAGVLALIMVVTAMPYSALAETQSNVDSINAKYSTMPATEFTPKKGMSSVYWSGSTERTADGVTYAEDTADASNVLYWPSQYDSTQTTLDQYKNLFWLKMFYPTAVLLWDGETDAYMPIMCITESTVWESGSFDSNRTIYYLAPYDKERDGAATSPAHSADFYADKWVGTGDKEDEDYNYQSYIKSSNYHVFESNVLAEWTSENSYYRFGNKANCDSASKLHIDSGITFTSNDGYSLARQLYWTANTYQYTEHFDATGNDNNTWQSSAITYVVNYKPLIDAANEAAEALKTFDQTDYTPDTVNAYYAAIQAMYDLDPNSYFNQNDGKTASDNAEIADDVNDCASAIKQCVTNYNNAKAALKRQYRISFTDSNGIVEYDNYYTEGAVVTPPADTPSATKYNETGHYTVSYAWSPAVSSSAAADVSYVEQELDGDVVAHTYSGYTSGTDSDGNHIHSRNCTACGYTESAKCTFVADASTTKAVTCTQDGVNGYKCSVCAYAYTTQGEKAKGHTPVTDAAVPATCTATGLTEGSHCSTCNAVLTKQEVIPANGHTEVIDPAVAQTCTTSGYTQGKHCSVCNAVLVERIELPATGHDYEISGNSIVCKNCGNKVEIVPADVDTDEMTFVKTVAPTCTQKGYTLYEYKGETYYSDLKDATRHTEVTDAAVAATCTATGLTEGKHCSVCNEVITKQEVTPALGHDYAKTVVAPTTSAQGYTTYTCTRCGDTYKTDYTAVLPSTDTNTNTNNTTSTDNSSSTTDSTATPTAEESKIAKQYGVDTETAKQIIYIINQYNISQQTAALTEKAMTSTVPKNDGDYAGSSFGLLKAKATNLKKNSITVKWNKVKGADGYIIYGAKCGKGKKYKKIATVSKGKTSYTQKKLKKGTYYKYNVVAYKNVNGVKVTIAASKKIHAITKGGKYGVAKSVKLNKSKVTLKKGKKFQIKASEVKQDKKIADHRKICYESSNTKVATVNSKGKITAKKKGKCTIYVYAQNGVYKTITVTVK